MSIIDHNSIFHFHPHLYIGENMWKCINHHLSCQFQLIWLYICFRVCGVMGAVVGGHGEAPIRLASVWGHLSLRSSLLISGTPDKCGILMERYLPQSPYISKWASFGLFGLYCLYSESMREAGVPKTIHRPHRRKHCLVQTHMGLYSLSRRTSYCKISWSL